MLAEIWLDKSCNSATMHIRRLLELFNNCWFWHCPNVSHCLPVLFVIQLNLPVFSFTPGSLPSGQLDSCTFLMDVAGESIKFATTFYDTTSMLSWKILTGLASAILLMLTTPSGSPVPPPDKNGKPSKYGQGGSLVYFCAYKHGPTVGYCGMGLWW